jgi:hypothetical protein
MAAIIWTIAVIAIVVIAFLLGRQIPASVSMAVIESNVATSGVVLGLAGAWVALVFPSAAKQVLSRNVTSNDHEVDRARRLLEAMAIAAACITFSIVSVALFPLRSQVAIGIGTVEAIRGGLFASVILQSIAIVSAIWRALIPGLLSLFALETDVFRVRRRERRFSQHQTESDKKQ